jgi:hypothetical protein
MRFQGALVKEQGITFAVVIVKSHVLNTQYSANETRSAFTPYFLAYRSGPILDLHAVFDDRDDDELGV